MPRKTKRMHPPHRGGGAAPRMGLTAASAASESHVCHTRWLLAKRMMGAIPPERGSRLGSRADNIS